LQFEQETLKLANTGFQTVYNYTGLEPHWI